MRRNWFKMLGGGLLAGLFFGLFYGMFYGFIVGLVVVAASVTVAILMHRTDHLNSCLRAPCPPLRIGYPLVETGL